MKRKIAVLRESVAAVLETLLAKQRRGRPDDAARAEATAAQRLLDGADDAIRRTKEHDSNWWEGRRALVESIPRLVAETVVSTPASEGKSDLAGVTEEALFRRGRAAYDVVAALQDTLASTLEQLSIASPLAHADPSSIRAFHPGGLPGTDLEELHREEPLRGPWWGGMFPSLAVQSTERMIREQPGKRSGKPWSSTTDESSRGSRRSSRGWSSSTRHRRGPFANRSGASQTDRTSPGPFPVKAIWRRT